MVVPIEDTRSYSEVQPSKDGKSFVTKSVTQKVGSLFSTTLFTEAVSAKGGEPEVAKFEVQPFVFDSSHVST